MKAILKDILSALRAAVHEWRHLRQRRARLERLRADPELF